MPRYTTDDDSDPPLPTWNSSDEERERLASLTARSNLHIRRSTPTQTLARAGPPSYHRSRIPQALTPTRTSSHATELLRIMAQDPPRTEIPSSARARLFPIMVQDSARTRTPPSRSFARTLTQNHRSPRTFTHSPMRAKPSSAPAHCPPNQSPVLVNDSGNNRVPAEELNAGNNDEDENQVNQSSHLADFTMTCPRILTRNAPATESPGLINDNAGNEEADGIAGDSDEDMNEDDQTRHLALFTTPPRTLTPRALSSHSARLTTPPRTLNQIPTRSESPSASAHLLLTNSPGPRAVDDDDSVCDADDNDSVYNEADTEDLDVDEDDEDDDNASFHPSDNDSEQDEPQADEDVTEDDDYSFHSREGLQGKRIAGPPDKAARINKNWRSFYVR